MTETVIATPDTTQLRNEESSWLTEAQKHKVTDQESLDQAGVLLQSIKAARKRIEETLGPIIKKAHETHGSLVSLRKQLEEPFEKAERMVKVELVNYTEKERERIATEQRQKEEAARKAAEDERLARAQQLQNQGRQAEAEAELDTPVVVETPVVAAPRASGVSVGGRWKARVDSPLALIKFVAEHPEYVNLVQANETALNDLARAQQAAMAIPGVTAFREATASVRGR